MIARTVSAATVIDAIITHAINSGTPPDGGILPPGASVKQFKRSSNITLPPGTSSMTVHPTEGSPYKAPSRSPSVKSDGNNQNDQGDGHATAPGSRPGSRSSSVVTTEPPGRPLNLGEKVDHMIGKDLQIQPATSTPPSTTPPGSQRSSTENANAGSETYWKRNNRYPHNSSTISTSSVSIIQPHQNSSAGGGTGSSTTSSTTDERQITRVAQSPSPKSANTRVESISPPSVKTSDGGAGAPQQRTPPIPASTADPMNRFLDARKRPIGAGGAQPSSQPQPSIPAGAPPPEGQGVGPGLSPLDYVKNKIVEEMTKGEGSSTTTNTSASAGGASSTAGVKRSGPGNQEDSNSKKPCLNTQVSTNSTNDLPPDSPGSPGEMGIDETARPDSVSSHKTASPAPNQIPSSASTAAVLPTSTNANSTNVTSAASMTSASNSSSAAPISLNSSSRYEPLSDDE